MHRMIAMRHLLIPGLALTLLLFCAPGVLSQDQDPPDDPEDPASLLPEINPQDIEIRGDFQARFPGLTRQPILGFSPESRVHQIDPDRMPYVESDEEIVAALPLSDLEEPLSPELAPIETPDRSALFTRLGAGQFMSLESRIYAEQPVGENGLLLADLDTHGSQGHDTPINRNTQFRYTSASGEYIHRSGSTEWRAGVNGRFDRNHLFRYGTTPVSQGVLQLQKSMRTLGAETEYTHLNNAFNGWNVGLEYRYFERAPDELNGYEREHRGDLSLRRFWEGSRIATRYAVEIDASAGQHSAWNEPWNLGRIGFYYERTVQQVNHLDLGLQAFQAYDPENGLGLKLYPDVTYEYNEISELQLIARLEGFVQEPDIQSFHLTNRYLYHTGSLDFETGVLGKIDAEYSLDNDWDLLGGLTYSRYFNYAYQQRDEATGAYQVAYDENADRFRIHAGWARDVVPEKLSMRGEVYGQLTSTTIGNQPKPYEEHAGASMSLYSNPLDNFYITAWADVKGPRAVGLTEERLDTLLLLGSQLEYRFSRNLGVYAKGLNLLNQNYEHWQGYVERPFQLYGGITLHF